MSASSNSPRSSDTFPSAAPRDVEKFEKLKSAGHARLQDALSASISQESRFELAYNAARALGFAAMHQAGYPPSHHALVFQLLPETLGLGPDVWQVLCKCHDIRSLGENNGNLNIDDRILTDLIVACQAVAQKLDALGPLDSV